MQKMLKLTNSKDFQTLSKWLIWFGLVLYMIGISLLYISKEIIFNEIFSTRSLPIFLIFMLAVLLLSLSAYINKTYKVITDAINIIVGSLIFIILVLVNSPSLDSPKLGSYLESQQAVTAQIDTLEDRAKEVYENSDEVGKTYKYTIDLNKTEPLILSHSWCTTTGRLLEQNFEHIYHVVRINKEIIPLKDFTVTETVYQYSKFPYCRNFFVVLYDWPEGDHFIEWRISFDQEIFDGVENFPKGEIIYKYYVSFGQ